MDPDLLAMLDPPDDALASIALFRERGLTDDDLDDFGAFTLTKAVVTPFRYFCGCCWRGIKQGWRAPREHTEDCGYYYAGDCDGSCQRTRHREVDTKPWCHGQCFAVGKCVLGCQPCSCGKRTYHYVPEECLE